MGPLIGVEELAGRLREVVVLDVRYRTGGSAGAGEFAAGHVPGASYVDLDTDLAGEPGRRGRHPLPDPDRFQAAMRRAGVGEDSHVVVYDDWQGRAAARCWWLLRHHGHARVQVLDGGWSAWRAAGLAEETGAGAERTGDLAVASGAMPVITLSEVGESEVLIDARAPERYRGETEPIDPVAGHIPAARNVPTEANLAPDGRFRPADELRETYAAVGAVPGTDVAVYCGSGVTACHDVLALEVAGVKAALFPGSWSEWVVDPHRPVQGPATSGCP